MSFDMAGELAELEDIATRTVIGNDDVASSVVGEEHKRRGASISILHLDDELEPLIAKSADTPSLPMARAC